MRRLARQAIDDYRPLLDRLKAESESRPKQLDGVLEPQLRRQEEAQRRLGE